MTCEVCEEWPHKKWETVCFLVNNRYDNCESCTRRLGYSKGRLNPIRLVRHNDALLCILCLEEELKKEGWWACLNYRSYEDVIFFHRQRALNVKSARK